MIPDRRLTSFTKFQSPSSWQRAVYFVLIKEICPEINRIAFSYKIIIFLKCENSDLGLKLMLNQLPLACFNAASMPRSGAWLNIVPQTLVGYSLDGDTLRIALYHRLGLRMCRPHN